MKATLDAVAIETWGAQATILDAVAIETWGAVATVLEQPKSQH